MEDDCGSDSVLQASDAESNRNEEPTDRPFLKLNHVGAPRR